MELTDAQLDEQIAFYEDQIKKLKENIRDELQIRRDLKAQITAARKREALEIQTLERLDEYKKMLIKQLELVEKHEDSESLKGKAMLEKFEDMLKKAEDLWTKYEEEYEQLPLAKKRTEAQNELLKSAVKRKVLEYKLREAKRNKNKQDAIDKRREQLKIIEFAKLYLDYKEREKRFKEISKEVENLRIKKENLRAEVSELEKRSVTEKRSKSIVGKSQQLPPVVDFSHLMIPNNKCQDQLDTMSINSYILEQEYMDDEDPNKNSSQTSQNKNTKSNDSQPKNSQERKQCDQAKMDLDEPENVSQPKQQGTKFIETNPVDEKNAKSNQARMNRKSSQECQANTALPSSTKTPKKRVTIQQPEKDDVHVTSVQDDVERMSIHDMSDRPVPSPVKMAKRSGHQPRQQQQQQSRDDFELNKDLSKLPQANKPHVKSVENVNFTNSHHNMHLNMMVTPSSMNATMQNNYRMELEIMQRATGMGAGDERFSCSTTPSASVSTTPQMIQYPVDRNPWQDSASSSKSIPPVKVAANSMMSASMHLDDPNVTDDNISAILGSDITEAGGSFGLARRIYGDTVSDDGDFDYENMMNKFCSPIAMIPGGQQQQLMADMNNQLQNLNDENRNVNFTQFGKKSNTKSKLF